MGRESGISDRQSSQDFARRGGYGGVVSGVGGKASMSTNGRVRTDDPNVAMSFSGLTHDAIELAELQAQLFALDVKSSSRKARTSLVLAVVGLCILLGTIPVALIALAELLNEVIGWPTAAGYGVATLVGLLISAGILLAAWASIRQGIVTMQRSRDELTKNIAWLKSSLRSRAQVNPVEEK